MKKFWVYIHTCPNGKKYVGTTTANKPEYRWKEGKGYYNNEYFTRAILKYGWDNITHEVFEVESKEEMYRKEIELISFYHSNDPEYGYNLSSGGEKSALGCRRSEETRQKMSLSWEKRKEDPEFIALLHRPKSESWKQARAESTVWKSPEHRAKMLEFNRKKALDPEYRKRMSEAKKGKPRNQPKYKYLLPDGTIRITAPNIIGREYTRKGIKTVLLGPADE